MMSGGSQSLFLIMVPERVESTLIVNFYKKQTQPRSKPARAVESLARPREMTLSRAPFGCSGPGKFPPQPPLDGPGTIRKEGPAYGTNFLIEINCQKTVLLSLIVIILYY